MKRKLKKIKGLDNFLQKDISKVMWNLKYEGLNKFSSPSSLIDFFENCEQLSFINNKKAINKLK